MKLAIKLPKIEGFLQVIPHFILPNFNYSLLQRKKIKNYFKLANFHFHTHLFNKKYFNKHIFFIFFLVLNVIINFKLNFNLNYS